MLLHEHEALWNIFRDQRSRSLTSAEADLRRRLAVRGDGARVWLHELAKVQRKLFEQVLTSSICIKNVSFLIAFSWPKYLLCTVSLHRK